MAGRLHAVGGVLGVGLGRHIDILTKVRDIDHVVVFEWDMDFLPQVYTRWIGRKLPYPHLLDDTKSFTFVLTPGAEHDDHRWRTLEPSAASVPDISHRYAFL